MIDAPDRAVLFLDVDGVVNHWALYAAREGRTDLGDEGEWVDPECVARVQRIVDATGCAIVLSSAWRLIVGRARTEAVLQSQGLRAPFLDATEDLTDLVTLRDRRGAEVMEWLSRHALCDRWVVIDDDVVDVDPTRFVRTNIAVGLTDADVERAISILRGNP